MVSGTLACMSHHQPRANAETTDPASHGLSEASHHNIGRIQILKLLRISHTGSIPVRKSRDEVQEW